MFMWIVVIAWMYVALMMAMAEATAANGSILGAIVTFLFYGVFPVLLAVYLLGTPARRKARRATEALETAERSEAPSAQPDAGSLSAGHVVPAERKEP